MKSAIFFFFLSLALFSCSTSAPSTSGQGTYTSPEAKAKDLTSKMVSILSLDKVQEDKVLTINVINEKLLQRLRPDQQSSIQATKENYHKELKGVLTSPQFEKFKNSFPAL